MNVEEIYTDYMINHDVEDGAAVRQSDAIVLNYICLLTGQDGAEIEDILTYAGSQREKQGFINGFLYALQLQEGGAAV